MNYTKDILEGKDLRDLFLEEDMSKMGLEDFALDLDDFMKKEKKKGKVKETTDPEEFLRRRREKETYKKGEGGYIHPSILIKDKDTGEQLSHDELMDKLTVRPKDILGQNSKMKHSGGEQVIFYNLNLPALEGLLVDEKERKLKTVTTCPYAGACKKLCYAMGGNYIRYDSGSLKPTRVLNYLMNDPDGFKAQLTSEIQRVSKNAAKKDMKVAIRWHDSGDFFKMKYLELAYDVAKATPDVRHYTYTKGITQARKSNAPENFQFAFSYGGKEDTKIDPKKEMFSDIVPKDLHTAISKEGTFSNWSSEDLSSLKDQVSKKFGINKDTILTYSEMMKKPEGNERKWNVLVGGGDGDDAATRKDVLGIYLLEH